MNRIIKLVMCRDAFKKAASRSEIASALKGDGVPSSASSVNALIERARERLKHVFGFELVEGSKDSLYCGEVFSQNTQVSSLLHGADRILMNLYARFCRTFMASFLVCGL